MCKITFYYIHFKLLAFNLSFSDDVFRLNGAPLLITTKVSVNPFKKLLKKTIGEKRYAVTIDSVSKQREHGFIVLNCHSEHKSFVVILRPKSVMADDAQYSEFKRKNTRVKSTFSQINTLSVNHADFDISANFSWEVYTEVKVGPSKLLPSVTAPETISFSDPENNTTININKTVKLGSGSFGAVYQYQDPKTGSFYALKTLVDKERPTGKTNPQKELKSRKSTVMLDNEMGIRQKLDAVKDDDFWTHYIATGSFEIKQRDQHLNVPFILMKFYKGKTLQDSVSPASPLSLHRCAELFSALGRRIIALHTKAKLAHRDLHSMNIMLLDDRKMVTPLILDFGLARSVDDKPNLVENECRLEHHTPPESGSNLYSGKKDDFWSIGCLALEALFGERPFAVSQGYQNSDAAKDFEEYLKKNNIHTRSNIPDESYQVLKMSWMLSPYTPNLTDITSLQCDLHHFRSKLELFMSDEQDIGLFLKFSEQVFYALQINPLHREIRM